jgi:hypothetical protein
MAQTVVQSAPSAELARDFIEQGVALRKAGDDRLALAAFARAYALEPSVEALAQLGLAEQALGSWLDAREHLESALDHGDDSWIMKHRATLEAASKEIEGRLGMLEVSCNVAGAELRLDGRVLGRTPLERPIRLVAGQSVLQIAALGYFEVTRLVQVDAGSLSRLDVVLISRPSSADATPLTALPGAGAGAASLHAATPPAVDASAVQRSSAPTVLMYTSLGLAVAGVAVGTTGYVMREVNVRLYNDNSRCSTALGIRRSEECPNEAAAWHRGEVLAIAGFSAAAAFGATSLFLWLERPRPTRSRLACLSSGAFVACSGHF